MTIPIHNKIDFQKMRAAGKLASQTLDLVAQAIKPGITTNELDKICHDFIISNGAIPAPLGYKGGMYGDGFPKSICTSVNHVICHGIPSKERKLKSGDIINIDVTVILKGYHGDTSRMFYVGKVPVHAQKLCETAYEAMMRGIEVVKPNATLRDIGEAIENFVNSKKYSCVRDFCGHGVGKKFHTEPSILHYNNKESNYQDLQLKEGMFFTIEPMVNQGTYQAIVSKVDGWTATTKDKKLSAQWEHSLSVTATGYEIFTKTK